MYVTSAQLRKFVRYEITVQDLNLDEDENGFEPYEVREEDIESFLDHMESIDRDPIRIAMEWAVPVFFHDTVRSALGLDETDDEYEDGNTDNILAADDLRLFRKIVTLLNRQYAQNAEIVDGKLHYHRDRLDLDEIHELVNDYMYNREKPFIEWEFPDSIKEEYINFIYDEENDHKDISEEEKTLFRRYLEELIAKDNVRAMEIKGYLHYGGSSIYPCDWYASRDVFEKAFRITQNPFFANTLGYIYYYGRCNNFVPEYEKAFPYFVFGNIYKLYESTYKLADMYKNGYGTFKSESTYCAMIRDLYGYALYDISKGEDKKFADIALRMGSIEEEYNNNPKQAYAFYLQAEFALKRRANEHRYGDSKVYRSVMEGKARTHDSFEHIKSKTIQTDDAEPLRMMLADSVCKAHVRKTKNGYKMTVNRVFRDGQEQPKNILMTFPEYDCCIYTDKIDLTFKDENDHLAGDYIFDDYILKFTDERNEEKIILTRNGNEVLAIPATLVFRCRKPE